MLQRDMESRRGGGAAVAKRHRCLRIDQQATLKIAECVCIGSMWRLGSEGGPELFEAGRAD